MPTRQEEPRGEKGKLLKFPCYPHDDRVTEKTPLVLSLLLKIIERKPKSCPPLSFFILLTDLKKKGDQAPTENVCLSLTLSLENSKF